MKIITSTVLLLCVVSAMATGSVTVERVSSGNVSIGGYPQFRFRIEGVQDVGLEERSKTDSPYTWAGVVDLFLVKDGQPIGQITFGHRSIRKNGNGYEGDFSWSLTRIIDLVTGMAVWPEPGRYTIKMLVKLNNHRQKIIALDGYDLSTETKPFEVVGFPPQIVLRKYGEEEWWVYSSGKPGEKFSLIWKRNLADHHWTTIQNFEIPPEGMHATGLTGLGNQGFFRISKIPD